MNKEEKGSQGRGNFSIGKAPTRVQITTQHKFRPLLPDGNAEFHWGKEGPTERDKHHNTTSQHLKSAQSERMIYSFKKPLLLMG